ncbi:hypothetical protein pipiens_016979 [Culex pipiens pipiens]|uniref:XRN2-binding (XTBD) domain-containing protein n=1 Tax=Culex pipiens pipiens TaxID=38569 RepID=A0ABD1CIQ0_CULPP
MSENCRIYPSEEADPRRPATLPDCHWALCRQFMERYQDLLPQEQVYALSHMFATTQLLLRGDAHQTMELVLDLVKDQLPVEAPEQVDNVEKCLWEREAEPEFPQTSPVVEIEAMDVSTSDVEVVVEETVPETDCSSPEIIVVDAEVPVLDCTNKSTSSEEPVAIPTLPNKTVPADESTTFQYVSRNLVLFDDDFNKTQTYFNRLGGDQLELTVKLDSNRCVTNVTIHVNTLILSQVSAKSRPTAMGKAIAQFFRVTKEHCFKVTTLSPKNALPRTTNIVQRVPFNGSPRATSSGKPLPSLGIDPAHYQKVMRDFQAGGDCGCHLVFSKEFTNLECNALQGIADQLKLRFRSYDLPKKRKQFILLASELPPQEIVRRIVLEQDAELRLQYEVCLPQQMSRARRIALEALKSSKNSANPQQHVPNAKQLKKGDTVPESYAEALASLTVFKPVRTLRSVDDVYRNLVLIGSNFHKTAQEFGWLNVESLRVSTKVLDEGGCSATVQAGKLGLVEAHEQSKRGATRRAQAAFFKRAKMFCYQINKVESPEVEVQVAKTEDPATNIDHYKCLIQDFWKDSFEQELVFSAEFTKADRQKFHSFAQDLNLQSSSDGEELRIYGRRLPALAIVERIVVAKDPKLSALFEVTAPRVGSRQTGEGGSP